MSTTQPRSRKANSPPTQSGRQTDVSSPPLKHQKLHNSDDKIVKEFGGPIGVTMMMIFFPLLMNYLWLCVQVKSGSLLSLLSVKDIKIFFGLIAEHATPTWFATKLYLGFCLLQGFLAYVMPGPIVKGLPIPSENNKQLEYRCNGVWSFYTLAVIALIVHNTGIFPLTSIVENFGPLMSVAIITGMACSFGMYFATMIGGKPIRMSGNVIYDIFMGAPLNPRIGRLDLKMFAEIRIPWVILFYVTVSAALKQREQAGHITPELWFMMLAHFLYVNACMKGEECIPTTWDIFYEKFGFMLIFWNMTGVPFTYCLSSLYLLKNGPQNHSNFHVAFCFGLLLFGYYIWDSAQSQKNRFRMQQRGTYIPRRTFPQLPWGTLKNPSYIQTKQGNMLLTGGWWAYARKIHYTADLMMALSWGLITGVQSFIPYFYVTFFVFVLVHRVSRDMERCARKYGEDWEEYCRKVPYIFIPGVF